MALNVPNLAVDINLHTDSGTWAKPTEGKSTEAHAKNHHRSLVKTKDKENTVTSSQRNDAHLQRSSESDAGAPLIQSHEGQKRHRFQELKEKNCQ